ncbi:MAG: rhamnogalacturonan acetylesterase [Bacteroidota bacterium]
MKKSLYVTAVSCMIAFASFILPPKHITVFLAGDSTMAEKRTTAYPETGWGMPFQYMFDSTVTVRNLAKNGASTRSFNTDGLWRKIDDDLKPGDCVLIQFGHNDEVPTKPTATTPAEFHNNLVKYITDTRAKEGIPILITPVARRKFDEHAMIQGTHDQYSAIVRTVAGEQHVPLIDLDMESQAMLQGYGIEVSKLFYNHLVPGEHPNFPKGIDDDTHFNELGARKMAEIVLADIRSLKLELANRIAHK